MHYPPPTYTNHSAALRRAADEPRCKPWALSLWTASFELDLAALTCAMDQSDANVGNMLLMWDGAREIHKMATGRDFPLD